MTSFLFAEASGGTQEMIDVNMLDSSGVGELWCDSVPILWGVHLRWSIRRLRNVSPASCNSKRRAALRLFNARPLVPEPDQLFRSYDDDRRR